MPGRTISSFAFGVTLAATDNPVTITGSGTVYGVANHAALLGPSPTSFTINNYGLVQNNIGGGIALSKGGLLVNNPGSAQVSGYTYGIAISGAAGTIVNGGLIQVRPVQSKQGPSQDAIILNAGGTVTNMAGGTVSAYALIGFGSAIVAGATATVINAGRIEGGQGFGVNLSAGGSVINSAGGMIFSDSGPRDGVVAGAIASVTNAGIIGGVGLYGGGSVSNAAGGTISSFYGISVSGGVGTITNAGLISGFAAAVTLAPG